jgi:hypothetical protein
MVLLPLVGFLGCLGSADALKKSEQEETQNIEQTCKSVE